MTFLKLLRFLRGIILATLFVQALAFSATENESAPCPACRGTAVCQANGCKDGKMLCPATCLKKELPGWTTKKIDGYPDGMLWMVFEYKTETGKGWQAYSQNHIGELIEYENGKPVNRGRCPKCEGSSRVTCSTCQGAAKCAACSGAGKFLRNQTLFTLTDVQGRAMEAVVRSRKGATITVMRLPDQKVFDIPLARLSAESVERIEQRFPSSP